MCVCVCVCDSHCLFVCYRLKMMMIQLLIVKVGQSRPSISEQSDTIAPLPDDDNSDRLSMRKQKFSTAISDRLSNRDGE